MNFLVGIGIIVAANALGVLASYVKAGINGKPARDVDSARFTSFAYACAIGVLCAVIW